MADITASPGMAGREPAAEQSGPIVAADGTPLKKKLAESMRKARWRAFLLTAPLLFFVILTFILPIGQMLTRSIHNDTYPEVMPLSSQALVNWDGQDIPDETVFEAMVMDLREARADRSIGRAATRVNYDAPGTRSMFTKSARRVDRLEPPFKQALIAVDEQWGELATWAAIKEASSPITTNFYLAAVDRKRMPDGSIAMQDENRQIYVQLFVRTFWMSALITILCLFLAFPVSYLLSVLPLKYSNLLMILVLLPFWTSLLVRTTAWIAMLQAEGVVNNIVVWAGLIEDEQRLQMIYNRTGTIIAMVHILLPFMILPLYSVMKTIPPSYMRAARSLGATQFTAFVRIYFPQTLPGIAAGTLLVFILAVGYYITPALVGGQSGQLISNLIAFHMQRSLNWSLAAALGGLLLASVLVLYWLYNRLVGIDKLRFG
jgi:putative spermidine/putrescine transport system permease protein